jgi:uncharacterized membrane protein YphA (DoxX/SURF4 family)
MTALNRWLTWRGHAWLALPLRLYLGFVFLWACLHKIAEPATFALDVATYQFLPLPLVNPMALILPWVEFVAGIAIILGWRIRAAALLIAVMMVMFIIALGWALYLGLDMSCGCFASSSQNDPISGLTLLRDGAWLAMALYVLIFDGKNPLGLDRWIGPKP